MKNLNISRWKFYPTIIICLFTLSMYLIAYLNYNKLINRIEQSTYYTQLNYKHTEPVWLTAKLTMYNAGDPAQTDSSPCISASGDNICTMIAQGQNVCASNFLPQGTKIRIKDLGNCIILDTMAKRYSTRIDWALPAEEKQQAIQWGIKDIQYTIIKYEKTK